MATHKFKRLNFIHHLKELGDPKRAAILAGYSKNPRSLQDTIPRLMGHPEVRQAMEEYNKKLDERILAGAEEAGMSAVEVLKEIKKAYYNATSESGKAKFLELAAKTHALLTDRHAVEQERKTQLAQVIEYTDFAENDTSAIEGAEDPALPEADTSKEDPNIR